MVTGSGEGEASNWFYFIKCNILRILCVLIMFLFYTTQPLESYWVHLLTLYNITSFRIQSVFIMFNRFKDTVCVYHVFVLYSVTA